MINQNDLLLVLPTLNEFDNLEVLIPRILNELPSLHLLVVDDGSSDKTAIYIEGLKSSGHPIEFIDRKAKLGIGSAHIRGLAFAVQHGYKFVITMDADQTHRVVDLKNLLRLGCKGSSMTIGSRYLRGGGVDGWSLFRNFLTRAGHFVTCIFFFSRLDMSSGMRMYKVTDIPLKIIEREAPSNYDFFFTTVIIYKKMGLNVDQVPIRLDPRGFGNSKMSFSLMLRGISRLLKVGLRIARIDIK